MFQSTSISTTRPLSTGEVCYALAELIRLKSSFFQYSRYLPSLERWRDRGLRIDRLHLPPNWRIQSKFQFQSSVYDPKLGHRIFGYGEDRNQSRAIQKSLSELLERESFFKMRMGNANSTNGFAVHTSTNLAIAASRNEIVERDAFLRHWLTRTPFAQDHALEGDRQFNSYRDLFDKNNFKLFMAKSYLGARGSSIAIAINNQNQCFAIGSGLKNNRKSSAVKALKELLLNI